MRLVDSQIQAQAKKYFNPSLCYPAVKLFESNVCSISFSKGSFDSYFIVSGIVKDSASHEVKVSYKKRLENSEQGPISTKCNCMQWSEKGHCVHTAAIFISFLYLKAHENNGQDFEISNDLNPPINLMGSYGVTPSEYGTIIPSPSQLDGASTNATYSSLQYLLHTKKVINFPIPSDFKGKLILNIDTKSKDYPLARFKYKDVEESESRRINLFESIYLFNWDSGQAFSLNSDQKQLINTLRTKLRGEAVNINELISHARKVDQASLEIQINSVALKDIPVSHPHCKIFLETKQNSSLIDFHILFQDEDSFKVAPPNFLSLFTHEGGVLNDFHRKKDSYEFIANLRAYFRQEQISFKGSLNKSKVRDFWSEEISKLEESSHSLEYDITRERLLSYDHKFLKEMLCLYIESFGEVFFRFASYSLEDLQIEYKITYNNLISGLFKFNRDLQAYGVEIYYNQTQIRGWKSNIRFERRKSNENWFDLDLQLSPEDLEVITQANLESGMALTKSGLLILDKDEKNLARFIQKYVKHEGSEISSKQQENQNGENENANDKLHRFTLPMSRARIFELFELKRLGVEGALTLEEEKLCESLASFEKIPSYPIPSKLKGDLRDYQKTGYRWLSFLYQYKLGACLADDMGLGKTLQTISFVESVYENWPKETDDPKILIVCPVSILLNWKSEFNKFSSLDVHVYHGPDRKLSDKANIIITSYGLMKRELTNLLKDMSFEILIMDEVQHLKNIRSLGAASARQIQANFRVCLTGTPVENDLSEFYNIIDLAIPGLWGDLEFIRTQSGSKSRLLARNLAKPFVLRRTKAQVLPELPPKEEQNILLNFSDDERQNYLKKLVGIKNSIQGSSSRQKYGEILKGLLRLRQACLWQDSDTQPGSYHSAKIDFLTKTLEQILQEGHQALIFSQFTSYLDLIQNKLHENCWSFSRIDGSMQMHKRHEQVERFQDGKTKLFLISLKAGGQGLNLTSASYVFLMDPWWNPAVESQAIDRAHRIGQENKLTVYRPIIKDSVEEKVLKLQEAKRELFRDLLPDDNDSYFTGKLSMQDFEHLLN